MLMDMYHSCRISWFIMMITYPIYTINGTSYNHHIMITNRQQFAENGHTFFPSFQTVWVLLISSDWLGVRWRTFKHPPAVEWCRYNHDIAPFCHSSFCHLQWLKRMVLGYSDFAGSSQKMGVLPSQLNMKPNKLRHLPPSPVLKSSKGTAFFRKFREFTIG